MRRLHQCRACGSKALTPAFSLEAVAPPRKSGGKPAPVDYVICDPAKDPNACGLLQSAVVGRSAAPVTPSSTYRINRSHLRSVATEALEVISGRDCAALDIGCSDGALLSFYPRWVERFGVDDSAAVESVGEWAHTQKATFPSAEFDAEIGEKKFDIITAVSVLEKTEEPRAFFARMKSLLAPDGVIVVETLYAPMALTRTNIESFAAGACSVYSLGVLESLVRDCNLKIFRGAITDKEGGSLRLFITHDAFEEYDFDPWYERLARLWDEENALALRAMQPYQAFQNRADDARDAYKSMLTTVRAMGETAHILSTGSLARAAYYWAGEAADAITAAVSERTPETGAYLCDHGPVVLSETECRAAQPDYLIAPAPLKREMMERWREVIMLGARMIVLSPEPHIVDASNFSAEFGKTLAGGDTAGEVETLRTILSVVGGPRLIAEDGRKTSSVG